MPNILEDAQKIVSGDRQNVYGHPADDFARSAALWSAYMGVSFTMEDVAYMMILLKLSRLKNSPQHRDSQVDIAGYARTAEMLTEVDMINVVEPPTTARIDGASVNSYFDKKKK